MVFNRFQGYFWKILSTIGMVSIGFMMIVLSTIAYYMVVPLGQQAADDLTSIITHAAGIFQERHGMAAGQEDTPPGERGPGR